MLRNNSNYQNQTQMKHTLLSLAMVLFTLFSFGQEKFTISGHVKDGESGEDLIGATIWVPELTTGTITNEYGFYSLTLPQGTYNIKYSYIGFNDTIIKFDLTASQSFDLELGSSSATLTTFNVTAEEDNENVSALEMSVNKIDIQQINEIPALLGEVDVVGAIKLLPGVTSVGEGASGFNVRGGGTDQNLVLLDEAPVYNSSHLFGFFSVFNPDAVKNVKLVKGGIPAQYGGRLSSLLDVRMKEGNKKKLAVSGGLGLIFSRLTIEAPIIKDKASFIIAGRRSYIDVLAKPFLNDDLKDAKFYFYDLTAKFNYEISKKDKLYLSGYFGRDVFDAGFGFNWGNATATLRWNHIFNDKLFMNTTAFYSNYDYELGVGDDTDGFNWNSNIINYSVKPEATYYANTNNTIKFGGQAIIYDFKPGSASFSSAGDVNDISLPDQRGLESALYVLNEQKLGARASLQYGLRVSHWNYLGPGTIYTYGDTTAGTIKPVLADQTREYGDWESVETYLNWEPRFAAKYDLTEMSSVKLSYNRMAQYIHLISNTTAGTPLDVWTPSTNNLRPQIADQIALGYFQNFKDNMFETSVEVYYKDMQNQVDYVDNANLLLNEFLEAELLTGVGRAYGAEFYVKKAKGDLTGWISYTLARSERQVEGINRGLWFPNRFDKLHNLNVVATYDLNPKWKFSGNFVFASGTPATFPTNRIEIQNWVVPHNSEERRNNYRIEPYHRLDLSVTYTAPKKEDVRFESYWVISIYNVYNRRNPFSVFFRPNENDPVVTEAVRYSVIGSVVPAVSWNFKF